MGPINQNRALAEMLASWEATQNNDVEVKPPQGTGVGVLGKALGALGLDISGDRAKTSWDEALDNTMGHGGGEQRSSLFPVARYTDGKSHLAVPGMVKWPLDSFESMWERGDEANITNPDALAQSSQESFDAAGLAATGGLAAGMAGAVPEGAVAANGIGRAASRLPMDEASRMARAREMGFDTDATYYHGTPYAGIEEFNPSTGGNYGPGVYTSQNPEVGQGYASSAGETIPLHVRGKIASPEDYKQRMAQYDGSDYHETQRQALQALQDDGFAGVHSASHMGDGKPAITNIFDPRNLRRTNAAFDPEQSGSSFLLAANSGTGAAVPLAMNAMEQSAPKGFTAYHGSPHDFDKFSLDKIGTGEGAQAYGHGLYFAENEAVAKSYRDQLGDYSKAVSWNGPEAPNPRQQTLMDMLQGTNVVGEAMTIDDLRRDLKRQAMGWRRMEYMDDATREARIAETNALYDEFERSQGNISLKPPGHMYEVNITSDPDQFLDWDKPLNQQPESVRKALEAKGMRTIGEKPTGDETGWTSVDSNIYKSDGVTANDQGAALFDRLSALYQRDPAKTSQALREAGIPGIRYLDQGSRIGGEGTAGSRNYVVFDDGLVDINRKYANHPMGAAAPLAFNDYDEQPVKNRKLAEALAR